MARVASTMCEPFRLANGRLPRALAATLLLLMIVNAAAAQDGDHQTSAGPAGQVPIHRTVDEHGSAAQAPPDRDASPSKAFGDLERVFPQVGPPPTNWATVDTSIVSTAQPPGAWSTFTPAKGGGDAVTPVPGPPEAAARASPSRDDPSPAPPSQTLSTREPASRDRAGDGRPGGHATSAAPTRAASLRPADGAPTSGARRPLRVLKGAGPAPRPAAGPPHRPRPLVEVASDKGAAQKAAARKPTAAPRWIPLPSVLEPTSKDPTGRS